MSYDPLSEVIDEPLSVSKKEVQKLTTLRASVKFSNLPDDDITEEQIRLSLAFNELLERLIARIELNPSKLWVMSQFQPTLEAIQIEDTEGREHFGTYLEQVMDILHIESSNGLLGSYL
jgi:hypothetical protein